MYFEIEKQAIDAINKALDQYDVEIDRNFKLEFPPNPKLGDLASTIAFDLTRKLRTSPPEVAAGLVEKIEVPEIFSKVQNFDLTLISSLTMKSSQNYYWKRLTIAMVSCRNTAKRLYWNILPQIRTDLCISDTSETQFSVIPLQGF